MMIFVFVLGLLLGAIGGVWGMIWQTKYFIRKGAYTAREITELVFDELKKEESWRQLVENASETTTEDLEKEE